MPSAVTDRRNYVQLPHSDISSSISPMLFKQELRVTKVTICNLTVKAGWMKTPFLSSNHYEYKFILVLHKMLASDNVRKL